MFRFPENESRDTILLPYEITGFFATHDRKNSDMVYLSSGGIYRISGKSVSLYARKPKIPADNKIINIISDSDYLWICTRGNGCYELIKGIYRKRYLENLAVTSVFKDRENNLWFNTMGKGVYMLSANADNVSNYNQQSGLSNDNIISIVSGMNDDVWLGYNNGTIEKISDNHKITYKLNKPYNPDFNRVTCMAIDSDLVLAGTDIGLYFIHNNKTKFIAVEMNQDDIRGNFAMKRLLVDKKRNIYAAHSNGILHIKRNYENYFLKEMFNSPLRNFALTEYLDQHLLISTTRGLIEYIPGQGYASFKTDTDFSAIRILDVKTMPGKVLALATNGKGIYILKDKKFFQRLSTANGLSDNNCKRIFITGDTIYVSTDNGLNILTKANDNWRVSQTITTKDGLLSNAINDAVISNGKIYLATEKALSVINQSSTNTSKFSGRVYVTEIVTDSVRAAIDTEYYFKADIPRLLIRFAYPVFSPSNNLKVKYRLLQRETSNSEWISSENNEVEFSSLSPGHYIFQMEPDAKSVNTAGITNLYINIIPLWWQTNIARLIFVLLAFGLVMVIIRRRIQTQYKKQVAELRQLTMLETERSRIASDMHDDIGADLTQISMWSGILDASGNKDLSLLPRITKSSNEVLQKMEQIIWALNSFQNHTSDLVAYLREFASQYLETAGIHLAFEADGTLPDIEFSAILKRNIFLTIKELLHNTVKHSGAKNVHIGIYYADSILHIKYTDDGKGFIPKVKEDGLGNITVQKRMKEINSTISIQSNPGKGFTAQLKVKLNNYQSGTKITV